MFAKIISSSKLSTFLEHTFPSRTDRRWRKNFSLCRKHDLIRIERTSEHRECGRPFPMWFTHWRLFTRKWEHDEERCRTKYTFRQNEKQLIASVEEIQSFAFARSISEPLSTSHKRKRKDRNEDSDSWFNDMKSEIQVQKKLRVEEIGVRNRELKLEEQGSKKKGNIEKWGGTDKQQGLTYFMRYLINLTKRLAIW